MAWEGAARPSCCQILGNPTGGLHRQLHGNHMDVVPLLTSALGIPCTTSTATRIKVSVEPWCGITSIVVSIPNTCLKAAVKASRCSWLALAPMLLIRVPSTSNDTRRGMAAAGPPQDLEGRRCRDRAGLKGDVKGVLRAQSRGPDRSTLMQQPIQIPVYLCPMYAICLQTLPTACVDMA